MPIQFTCPFCGVQTNVADQYAGQSGPCASCGRTITVPSTPGAAPLAAAPPQKSSSTAWVVVLVVLGVLGMLVVCGGILAALLLPAVQAAREAARRAQCTNNMRQIAVALLQYESQYGQFPPAYVADKDGKPLYSWRGLILPMLEQQGLYEQYKLDEPWDSPNNQVVAKTGISVFHCPSSPPGDLTKTDYVMVVGPGCVSDGPTGGNTGKIRDGTSNTILLVEVANSNIGWAEPRDLDAKTMSYLINDPDRPGECISSNHPSVVMTAFADGHVEAVHDGMNPETVRQLTQVGDGEPKTMNWQD
jgi:prepilin-type processing-associated H-X9-DG protein